MRDICIEHWKTYGRDYYIRFDYEGLSTDHANVVKENVAKSLESFKNLNQGNTSFVFEYTDPVDHSVSKNQGWIFRFENGSRIIFRVSGTSSSGATIRIYFEKYTDPNGNLENEVLNQIESEDNNLVKLALDMSQINIVSGRSGPTVIT